MANPEHLAILKQGVEQWNRWRGEAPDVRPNLEAADLRGEDFSVTDKVSLDYPHAGKFMRNLYQARMRTAAPSAFGIDFHGVELRGARLSEANLFRANLTGATLQWAHLTRATLREAELFGSDLSDATVAEADLRKAMLHGATLRKANLRSANLAQARFSQADLTGADLSWANLRGVYGEDSILIGADLSYANLIKANLWGAKLAGANLTQSRLVHTILREADMTGCSVFGVSAWGVDLSETTQENLVITRKGQPGITVDNLEVAQFVYVLLNNARVRQVIDTLTSKVVLILGRFTPERKAVLEALREELRNRNYTPVLFDFEKPVSRDLTETVATLAHMARFVIADITDAKSIPQELERIVPDLPSVPVQPLLLASQHEYGMFEHFRRYPWVLEPVLYEDQERLLTDLEAKVITPAEAKAKQQTGR
jgi:uncharacterized protein YjbI with pentapeptide repeats